MSKKITAAITAVAGWVPEDRLTNFDLEKMVDTNDEWIRTRTGISERGGSGIRSGRVRMRIRRLH